MRHDIRKHTVSHGRNLYNHDIGRGWTSNVAVDHMAKSKKEEGEVTSLKIRWDATAQLALSKAAESSYSIDH